MGYVNSLESGYTLQIASDQPASWSGLSKRWLIGSGFHDPQKVSTFVSFGEFLAQFFSYWKLMKPEVELLAIMVSVYLVMSLQLWVATWFGRWVAGNGWTCLVGWLEMFWEWRFVGFLNSRGGFKSKVSTSVWPDPVDECSRILPASRYSLEILPTYPSNQLIFIHGKLGEIT